MKSGVVPYLLIPLVGVYDIAKQHGTANYIHKTVCAKKKSSFRWRENKRKSYINYILNTSHIVLLTA